jgi:AcrR family transcriptional regulator
MRPPAATDTTAAPKGERTQRADARRNHERILEAARELMGREGVDAQIDDIARAAGVGVGTVYRHFPTKDALVEALASYRFERLAEWATEALADDDPWAGFERYLRRGAELQAEDRALSEVMRSRGEVMREAADRVGLMDLNRKLIRRAQAAGEMRSEIRAEDIPMVMCGLGTATCSTPGQIAGPDGWRRYVEILLNGMRAPGRG